MNWQPIETAPQHDADVLLCFSYERNGKTVWCYDVGIWWDHTKEWAFIGEPDTPPRYWCKLEPPTETMP